MFLIISMALKRQIALSMAYQESNESLDLAGQLIFGAFGAEGRLPVRIDKFPKLKEPVKNCFPG